MLEKYIKDLSPELQEKARKCGSVSELLELAKAEKTELPPEALEAIAGGKGQEAVSCGDPACPKCGSKDYGITSKEYNGHYVRYHYKCNNCGHEWHEDGILP